jgi:type VI protein secretion system component VasA
MSVVEFHLDPEQGKITSGLPIPRHTLLSSAPVNGVACQFRTSYETTLWPLKVTGAGWKSADLLNLGARVPNMAGALWVRLECLPDISFSKLDLKTLRFFLQGDGTLVHTLLELICNKCVQIVIRGASVASVPSVNGNRAKRVRSHHELWEDRRIMLQSHKGCPEKTARQARTYNIFLAADVVAVLESNWSPNSAFVCRHSA